jgi:hypothetical protein
MTDLTLELLKAELAPLREALPLILARMASLESYVVGLQNVDFGFLQAAARRAIDDRKEAREFQRRVDIKLDEIYTSMATSPEIKKLREEVSESLTQQSDLDLRISAIESRLGIKNPLAT